MINKTYKYLVIDKNDMSRLDHTDRENFVVSKLFNRNNQFRPNQFVIVKDEKKVINFSSITKITAEWAIIFRKAEALLKNA